MNSDSKSGLSGARKKLACVSSTSDIAAARVKSRPKTRDVAMGREITRRQGPPFASMLLTQRSRRRRKQVARDRLRLCDSVDDVGEGPCVTVRERERRVADDRAHDRGGIE